VRTDLGGLYFHAWCVLVLGLIYLQDGSGILLLAVVLVQIQMLQQLIPVVRFDGYYVLADLAGVPDLFSRVGPVLRSLRPGEPADPRVLELKPAARRIIAVWVVVVVPVLAALFAWLIWTVPDLVDSARIGITAQRAAFADAWPDDVGAMALAVISVVLILLPLVGLAILLWRLGGSLLRFVRAVLRRASERRSTRSAASVRRVPASAPVPASRPVPASAPEPAFASVPAPASSSGPGRDDDPFAIAPDVAAAVAAFPAHRAASAADFTDATMLDSRPPAPGSGWRKAVYVGSGHTVNPGLSRAERRRAELEDRLRTPIAGSRRVVVMSRKGGVGKTTTTLALGSIFAMLRGDRVVAVDANPDAGNLAHRLAPPHSRKITDLLREVDQVGSYAVLRDFTSQAVESRLEVLASDDDPRIGQALGREEYHSLITLLDRFYNLILLDTGTGILDSANQGLLEEADQLVLVLGPGLDGGRAAALTLDWLDEHGFESLVARAVVVINGVRRGQDRTQDRMREHFERRCQQVLTVPWDPALATGAQTSISSLRRQTRDDLVQVAAAVADIFREQELRR
jgi:putative peptide zinc metalloprotease protein